MKKLLSLLALSFAVSAPAHAGFGVTAYMGGTNDAAALGVWAPSLDYRANGWLVQLHALDLIGELPNENLDFGFDVSAIVAKRKVGADIEGVVMPGVTFNLHSDFGFDSPGWQASVMTRMGAEIKQGMGFGIYVVPQIGASNLITGDVGLSYGGSVQISTWFKK